MADRDTSTILLHFFSGLSSVRIIFDVRVNFFAENEHFSTNLRRAEINGFFAIFQKRIALMEVGKVFLYGRCKKENQPKESVL